MQSISFAHQFKKIYLIKGVIQNIFEEDLLKSLEAKDGPCNNRK